MQIGISEVLAFINTPEKGAFSLKWVRVNDGKGGGKGTAKYVANAVKHTVSSSRPSTRKKESPNIRATRLLRIKDLDAGHPVDVSISTIIEFNGQSVRH